MRGAGENDGEDRAFGDFLDSILASLRHAPDVETFDAAIGSAAVALGFPSYACVVFRQRGQWLNRGTAPFRCGNLPPECLDLDKAPSRLQPDSIPFRAATGRRPFVWRRDGTPAPHAEASAGDETTSSARLSLRGLALPVHGPQGEFGFLSVATAAHDPGFPERVATARHALHVVAIEAHAMAVEKFMTPPAPAAGGLTSKEREVLRWIALGKTSYEIAVILERSEATVNFHLAAILRKLEASNRPHAVLKALELDELSL
jgi:LuxR family quorum-sensing transcriptional regulator LasR